MKPPTKAFFMQLATVLLLVAGAFYLHTHGIQDHRWYVVTMTSSVNPRNSSLLGRSVLVDDKSSVMVTTIKKNVAAVSPEESYMIIASVRCKCKQSLSMNDRGWKTELLVSSQDVHRAIRTAVSLPDDAVTHLNDGKLLLP